MYKATRTDKVLGILILSLFILGGYLEGIPDTPQKSPVTAQATFTPARYEFTTTPYYRIVETPKTKNKLNRSTVILLAKIINHEAGAEPMKGKLAVGTVILNRANQNQSKIKSVVLAKNQFSGISRGHIEREKPNKDSIKAAEKILMGYRSFGKEIRYFCNEKTSTNSWMQNNCKRVMKIGNHSFYKK